MDTILQQLQTGIVAQKCTEETGSPMHALKQNQDAFTDIVSYSRLKVASL
jgi:hypothetical protein